MSKETENGNKPGTDEETETGNEGFMAALESAVEVYNDSISDPDRLTAAIAKCREIIQSYPSAAEPYFLLALVAYRCGDEGQAITMCETAHKLEPETREYAEALSVIMTSVGQFADGLYFAKLVPTLEPHPYLSKMMPDRLKDLQGAFESASPSTHLAEATRLFNLADYARVIKECSSEIRLNPRNFPAYVLFARTLILAGSFSQAVNASHAAIQIDPTAALPRAMLARALVHLGEFSEASAVAEQALRMADADAEVFAQAMTALLQCPGYPLSRAKEHSIEFHRAFEIENETSEPDAIPADDNRPVNVGLLSNAFFTNPHNDQFNTWFVLKRDPSIVFHGYQQSVLNDSATTAAKGVCEHWREIYDVDPFTLAVTIEADELDVLVDLSGTNWISRVDVAGLKPCPLRIGTFGLPEPGFAPGVSHILCDDVLAGANEDVLLPGQETIVVNGTLFARPPYMALLDDIPSPAEKNGYVTFGGTLDLARLSPECAAVWSELLLAVPNSKLLLSGGEYAIDKVKAKVFEYFSHSGVIDRVMFSEADDTTEPSIETIEATIPNSHWKEIDIFLDTFPMNCQAELCEALWTGAPVISMKSDRRRGMVGASILTAAKRLNWVASTAKEFIEIGVDLGSNLDKLKKERERLQKNVGSSALFDAEGLARQVRSSLAEVALNSRAKAGSKS